MAAITKGQLNLQHNEGTPLETQKPLESEVVKLSKEILSQISAQVDDDKPTFWEKHGLGICILIGILFIVGGGIFAIVYKKHH